MCSRTSDRLRPITAGIGHNLIMLITSLAFANNLISILMSHLGFANAVFAHRKCRIYES